MPAPINGLLIDGSFDELSEEFALYIDDLKKKRGEDGSVKDEIVSDLQNRKQDEVLKKIVTASAVLNSAPEKEFIAAYNLLVHLVRQSPNYDKFFARMCQNLSKPVASSPTNGAGLALSVLTSIFNILPFDDENRYNVFLTIVRVCQSTLSFELLRPQLKNLDTWLTQWETDEEYQLKLFLSISEAAKASGDTEQAYFYILRALRSIPPRESGSPEARKLSIQALKTALSDPSHYDFQDIITLDSTQALRKTDPILFELLEIFNADQLEEFNDFCEEHEGWIEEQNLDHDVLLRKMRLLTLTSLAASTSTRSLPYLHISKALQIPEEDVEMWVIDVIRAGLVEGKLSQLNSTFLIHRSTYRVFGEKQWTEVAGRLDTWRNSLEGVLAVVRQEREKMIREKERELRELEGKVNGKGGGERTNQEKGS